MPRANTAHAREQLAFSILRALEIIFLVVLYALSFSLRGALLLMLGRREQCVELLGEHLARLCERLGPTFIKVGQVFSSRPDLLPASLVAPLIRLQDQIAPFDVAIIPGIIEEAFGQPFNQVFDSFDLAPVASASIAQVHRAHLKDGRKVAVKIRRPGISPLVEHDLQLLLFMSKVLAALPGMSTVPLTELVNDVGAHIRQQLDFNLEAANNRQFRRHFDGIEYIKMPELVEHLCTENVLTMEYLDGLRRIDPARFNMQERKTAALAGLRALYKMIFTDGLIHADMHPGNVFVREWGEFVILDMGLVAHLTEADRQDFTDFFFGLVNNQGKECARIIYQHASYCAGNFNRAAFEAAMVELIQRHSALKSQEFEVARFVHQLIETQRRFKLRGSTKFMMTILSMVVFDGICKQLYPECDFQFEARGFLITSRYSRNQAGRGRLPHRASYNRGRQGAYWMEVEAN
jgi:ubiquinone biosynthesis protein